VTRPTLPIERAWSGRPGTVAWTRVLAPLARACGAVSAASRRRAERERVRIEGVAVLAFGGLVAGGSGKSSVVRWFARLLLDGGANRVAVLLRGYGARRRGGEAELVPDYPGLDPSGRVGRYGDDALAHRAELPPSAAVVVGADRRDGALAARDGFGAEILLLDDGWEQRGVLWDRLIAVLDPDEPAGNGRLLPAGPLRRPVETLREASVAAFVLEDADALPARTEAFLARHAPAASRLLLRRRLAGIAALGGAPPEPAYPGARVGVVSGVGAPDRLARFLKSEGLTVVAHAAYPNHAAWSAGGMDSTVRGLRRAGAEQILITGKDEPRWPAALRPGIPVRVIRTELSAVGPPVDLQAILPRQGGWRAGTPSARLSGSRGGGGSW
jgi:tetraacyldisaccharide 4'-kinase